MVLWDADNKHTDIVLSDSDLTAGWGGTDYVFGQILATLGKTSGKWYFEVDIVVDPVIYANCNIGVQNGNESLNVYIGDTLDGWGYMRNARFYNSALTYPDDSPTFTNGDVIMVAVDMDSGYIWFGKNGVWLPVSASSPNPATGTDPHYTNLADTIYPAFCPYHTSWYGTAHFKSSDMDYTIPSGFSAWEVDLFDCVIQIWTDENYVYVSTSDGLSMIDIESEQKYAKATYSGGFTTVYADNDRVYLGTDNSGVKYINKTCISGSIVSPIELNGCLENYTEQSLTSDEIRYIHGNNGFLMCCTAVGVDVIKKEPYGYRSYTTVSGARKCFMTSTGKCYYSTCSGTSWELNRVNIPLTDWSTPSYVYGDPLISSNEITDMFVTEGTASDGVSNTLMVATISGVCLVDESDLSLKIYNTQSSFSGAINILAGTSNHFTSIWAYDNKMYVASSDAFSVVNLESGALVDCYTQTFGGNNNETLISDDVVDINANM